MIVFCVVGSVRFSFCGWLISKCCLVCFCVCLLVGCSGSCLMILLLLVGVYGVVGVRFVVIVLISSRVVVFMVLVLVCWFCWMVDC